MKNRVILLGISLILSAVFQSPRLFVSAYTEEKCLDDSVYISENETPDFPDVLLEPEQEEQDTQEEDNTLNSTPFFTPQVLNLEKSLLPISSTLYQDILHNTLLQSAVMTQRSYRWQYSVDEVVETMPADSVFRGVKKGELLALRLQVDNGGKISSGDTSYILQYAEKGSVNCDRKLGWRNITNSTPISYSETSENNIILPQTDVRKSCESGRCDEFIQGSWATEKTTVNILSNHFTELGFTLDTKNAVSESTYCFRVVQVVEDKVQELNGKYVNYPELVLLTEIEKKFRKDLKTNKLPEIKTDTTNFQTTESPQFDLEYFELTEVTEPYIKDVVEENRVFEEGDFRIVSDVYNHNGQKTDIIPQITFIPDGHVFIEIPQQNELVPGRYTLKVEVEEKENTNFLLEQDFTWGVLAINTNKAAYLPDENVKFLMTVLDDRGATVCNADVQLMVTSPGGTQTVFTNSNGTITNSEECGPNNVTYVPDYLAEFGGLTEIGVYTMEMTAITPNGERSLVDRFRVEETLSFEIERIGPVRIYPVADYTMRIKIKSNNDFIGEVTEVVPDSFKILNPKFDTRHKFEVQSSNDKKVLTWSVDWEKGETYELTYTFDAPDVSPEFYLLGPIQLNGSPAFAEDDKEAGDGALRQAQGDMYFTEARQWQIASDAVGDFAVFRDSTGVDAINTTVTDITWDTTVSDTTSTFALQTNNIDIDMSEAGHYFVSYSVPTASASGGSTRSEMQSWLRLNDSSNLVYGRGQGYIRREENNFEGYNYGAAIIDLSANDDIRVQMQRTDTGSGTVQRRAAKSGISFLRLDDTWDYIRTRPSSNQSFGTDTNFTDLTLATDDEIDTDGFSRSGASITLKNSGHYLVTYNVQLTHTDSTVRINDEARLVLDGTEIDGTRVTEYLRGYESCNDGTITWTGIINTSSSDQVLKVQIRRESEVNASGHTTVATGTGITIAKLPEAADYVRLGEQTGGQDLSTSRTVVTWDETLEEDSGSFDHDATNTERINIDADGDYLFFNSQYASRAAGNATRETQFAEWRNSNTSATGTDTGGVYQYGGHGEFNRGDQGSYDARTSGSSTGLIMVGLDDTEYVELTQINEATNATSTYQADRMGVQGVRISTLFTAAPSLRQMHYHWRNDDGSESAATSATSGNEDTNIIDLAKDATRRLRIEVSNEGDLISASTQYRLEYGVKSTTCGAISSWTDVGTGGGGDWDMVASQLVEGNDTTNIAESIGGVTDENTTFETPNSAQKETSSQTAGVTLSTTEFVEIEYSIEALSAATDGATYCFRVTNAGATINSYDVYPEATLQDDDLTQSHYHWRSDDGSESAATSATGGTDDTALNFFAKQTPIRLRMEVSNEGVLTSSSTQYRLEWGVKQTSCADISSWINVDTVSDAWEMYNTTNLTDGDDTTNIAESIGGVADENTTFLVDNNAVKDISSTTAGIVLTGSDFVELEYSIQATSSATSGANYCFRVTNAGSEINSYDTYPEVNLYLDDVIGEYGTASLTDDDWKTVNLEYTYENLVVVASARYGPTNDVQRVPRVKSKTTTSFQIKVDNYPDSVSGTTTVDWLAMEEGVWDIPDGTGTSQIIAGSVNTSVNVCRNNWTGGTTVNFSPSFTSAPVVLHTVASDSDTNWTATHVDGGIQTSEPTTSSMRIALMLSYVDCATSPHSAEDIDYIAFEPDYGTNNSVEFDFVHGADGTVSCCNTTGYARPFDSGAFSDAPEVTLVAQLGEDGGDGAWVSTHPGTATTATNHYSTADEGGPSADRAHTDEPIAIVAFNNNSGKVLADVEYNQAAYRWFENSNSTDVGSVLAAQDTAATLVSDGQAFRLRTLINVSNDDLHRYGGSFKLQFAERSGTCDTGFSGETYIDVATNTAIAYNNNATPSDGDALTNNANDPDYTGTEVNQTYEEVNSFSNDVAKISTGENGKWDFALIDNSAPASTSYCFRILTADGSVLDTYTVIPEVTTATSNQSPNSPTSLNQNKTDDTSIVVADWVDETSVKFRASASDPDDPEILSLCIEADQLGTAFSDIEDSCGTGVSYLGTSVTVSHTLTGLTQGSEYHWQARIKDTANAYSSWVSFESNAESERDFGIDTTVPGVGTVYDGDTIGSDDDENDGSLTVIESNWSGFIDSQSGVKKYQYAMGTTAGGTDIVSWKDKTEPGNLFSDEFESGDLSVWDATSIDVDDLYASTDASYMGLYGLKVNIDDGNSIYVEDDNSGNHDYYVRFYLNPNNLTMASGDTFTIVDMAG